MTEEVYDMTLKTPFNMIISGSSGSGKTAKITKLLQFKDILLDEPTKQVIFFCDYPFCIKFVFWWPSVFNHETLKN